MTSIIPILSSRVSDVLIRQRNLAQLQFNQLELIRLQSQITSGRRFTIPSEDPQAALRGISLDRLIERKDQSLENINAAQSFLTAADSAIGSIVDMARGIYADTVSAVDVTSTTQQRDTLRAQIDQAIGQLVDLGNQSFRGRYIFAGSRAHISPYARVGSSVQYVGNGGDLQTYADVDLLVSSNVDGNRVLGGLSDQVHGAAQLGPNVTESTRLVDLNRGQGVRAGSIEISDGIISRIVDLSSADTVGDVIRLIEGSGGTQPPVTARITSSGITLQLTGSIGNLTVSEVAGATTARDLGIVNTSGVGLGTLVGGNLHPRLTTQTSLDDVMGVRATALVKPGGPNNDMEFVARTRGAAMNNVTISFLAGGTAGSESVAYDANAKTLQVTIEDGVSTAAQIVAAVEAANVPFTARLDSHESGGNTGQGTVHATAVDSAATAVTGVDGEAGSGIEPDWSSGVQIINGGPAQVVSFGAARTIGDVLNALNDSGANVAAHLNDAGDGINVATRLSGVDFSIGENGGTTAGNLGIRSFTTTTRLADLNYGRGVHHVTGPDFLVRLKDGTELSIDVSNAMTIQDVLTAINSNPQNQDPATRAVAQLARFGNGIELTTASTATNASLAVLRTNSSQAAVDLGLVPVGADVSNPAASSAGTDTITGRDVNPQEAQGLFTALLRLREALRVNDDQEIQRAAALLDRATQDANFTRAEVGARQQSLDAVKTRLEDEKVELADALSRQIDADLTQVLSDYAGRETAFQAALQTTAQLSRLSLLDFL